mmetsp:Transcript_296/g.537  ORF Transcript_296/g.537 Transcript_296/m.537 type:complete len:545 (+) Transcript_296:57-1691(+)
MNQEKKSLLGGEAVNSMEASPIYQDDDDYGVKEPSTTFKSRVKEKINKYQSIISIVIMILINFLDYVTFAIVFPSLLYYIQHLGGTEGFYGYCLTAYSLAQAVFAPILGYWANARSFREVMLVSLVLEVVASIFYAIAQEKWTVLACRIVLGIAAGSSAVTKAYLSAVTTTKNRTIVMTLVTAAQTLGFIAGPGFGFFFTLVNIKVSESPFRIEFNEYTLTGWFSGALGVVCCLLTFFFLLEPKKNVLKKKYRKRGMLTEHDKTLLTTKQQAKPAPDTSIVLDDLDDLVDQPDDDKKKKVYIKKKVRRLRRKSKEYIQWIPVLVMIFCWFTSTVSFTIFESLAAAISKDLFGWGVRENSIMWMGTAVTSIISMVFFMGYYPIAGLIKKVTKIPVIPDPLMLILTFCVMLLSLFFFNAWDGTLEEWRYILGAVVLSIGFPANQSLITSIYSKVLDENNQGTWMGYMTTCGAVSRIAAPLIALFIYSNIQFTWVFIIAEMIMVTSIILVIFGYCFIKTHPSQLVHVEESLPSPVLDEDDIEEQLSS